MADVSEPINFSFVEEAKSFKLHMPRPGETDHYIEVFEETGRCIGVARFIAPPDSSFHVWISQGGEVVVTYH